MNKQLLYQLNNLLIKTSFIVLFIIIFISVKAPSLAQAQEIATQSAKTSCLWQICSVDTMKVSRDEARLQLHNSSFDIEIQKEIKMIKATGANYVTVDTPYDAEFLPYLKRWVNAARDQNMHVWFRGNWSSWEGWFGYPKDMAPSEHLASTSAFIKANPDIFEDGDVFEGCPECENAGHWIEPQDNPSYNHFLQQQIKTDNDAFSQIGKRVMTNISSISGGYARGLLDQETVDSLDKLVSIDHYVHSPEGMDDYINYFHNTFDSRIVISEFGAPIPGITQNMTETQQADFVDSIYNELYKQGDTILGVNYWVLTEGSSPLLNSDDSPRKVYSIVKNYFSPGMITGKVTDPFGNRLSDISITASPDAILTTTDSHGNYKLPIPPRTVTLTSGGDGYTTDSHSITIATPGAQLKQNFVIKPLKFDLHYQLRCLLYQLKILEKGDIQAFLKLPPCGR